MKLWALGLTLVLVGSGVYFYEKGQKERIIWVETEQGDDPRLKAAEAEARRRFPEFEQAFIEKRGAAFLIKTRFAKADHGEYMWSEVSSIGREQISATLVQNPSNPALPQAGTKITVTRGEIEDWGVQDANGNLVLGAFTDSVLQQMETERKSKEKKR